MDPVRETIDGVEYELELWNFADHQRWLFILMAIVGRVNALGGGDATATMILDAYFDAELLTQLWTVCRKYTKRIAPDAAGVETVLTLERLETKKPAEPTPDWALAQLMRKHVELQFSDFFRKRREQLAAKQTETSSGSQSPPA